MKTDLKLTTKKTMKYIFKRTKNFPESEIILKNCIEDNLNELIELVFYFFNNDKINIKIKYLKDIVVKLNIIGFYVNLSYEKNLISINRHNDIVKYLDDIRKISYVTLRYQKTLRSEANAV